MPPSNLISLSVWSRLQTPASSFAGSSIFHTDCIVLDGMDWVTVISSLIVLWIASLCKIMHTACSSSKTRFLNDGDRKNILLVIAHPDDESMFFTPTINYFASRGHNLHIICMSTGNADGMGNIRKEELYRASAVLKVPQQQVKTLDYPEFQDGFGKVWNSDLLARIIKKEFPSHSIDMIITFDDYGVSGHCNHRDVNRGIRKILQDSAGGGIEAWELVSTNFFRKYSGPVDIWLSLIHAMFYQSGKFLCLVNVDPLKSYNAMAQHASQWVWFRKLFVSLSSYTYVNTLRKMEE